MGASQIDYFEAVQEGRARVRDAIEVLQSVAGVSYPMLFLKIGVTDWTPVGKEMLHSLVPGKNETSALVICDAEGNSKAMSTWLPISKVEEFSTTLTSKGIPKFDGEVKLPV